jgi:hypothetical protein
MQNHLLKIQLYNLVKTLKQKENPKIPKTSDIEFHHDFLTMSKPRTEIHNVMMQYFIISVTALLVTTKSPNGCEEGYFTGYLISLSLFAVSVFFSLVCYAIV